MNSNISTTSANAIPETKSNQFFKRNSRIELKGNPFWAMVQKEMTDYFRSWRFIILIAIIGLTCMGSLYTALSNIAKAVTANESDNPFFFLKLFTISDGSLPSYFIFISFLGPLLGISLGFDAVNSEHNKGTLSRILAQPIPRDFVLNAKFVASVIVVSILFFTLSFMVLGIGLFSLGIPPTAGEFMRIIFFTLVSIIYVAFWLNLSIYFSVRFKQPATSAISGIAVWLFFSVFYPIIVNIITKSFKPSAFASPRAIMFYEKLNFALVQIMPNELFSEATSTLLVPSMRSIGPLTNQQMIGAVPGPLPLGQSLMLIWPQLTGLLAITLLCFALSYVAFMRREIRSH